MVAGFLPHIDPAIAKYPKEGGNSASVRNVELMAACSECLFQGWNDTYSDPVPMEFADGQTRLTHVVAALSVSDQQEADKLLGDPLSCHFCTVPESHYLTPELSFPAKTASSVLKKVLDAAGGNFLRQPRQLIGRSPEGHRIWLGTHEQYRDARRSAGGVHLVHNILYEIVHMDVNHTVSFSFTYQLHAITYILHAIYTQLHANSDLSLSQLLSDTLHHVDHGTTCFLFRASLLFCERFAVDIGAEGLTFRLLERRLNNNFEPYKGEDGQIFKGEHACMMSMSSFVRQTFEHIHKHKGKPHSRVRGSDLQQLLLISPFLFDNLFQQEVESWNERHDIFVHDPSHEILPVIHTKLTFYQLYREDAKCVEEMFQMNCEAKKFLVQCRETFKDFKNGKEGQQKHICSSNKMHRLVHCGEQAALFGNIENFLAMAEIVHKVNIKSPQHLTNKSDKTGPGLLKVSERREAVRMLLEGYQGM